MVDALDFGEARWGIARDLDELTLSLIPLAISALLLAAWAFYYATDWWSTPGQGGGAYPAMLIALGWLLLVLAALPRPRWWDEL